jgi:hypothetical protein
MSLNARGCLDGPIWWLGPLAIFVALLALAILALPVKSPDEARPKPEIPASSSLHVSRN